MHGLAGQNEDSVADYLAALELAEPEGYIDLFVESGLEVAEALAALSQGKPLAANVRDHVARILDAFASSRPAGATPDEAPAGSTGLIEPLTDREMDVLRQIAAGLTYTEMADRLFISLNTVRSHVKAIYGKLDVNNRTRAIEAARRLGLL